MTFFPWAGDRQVVKGYIFLPLDYVPYQHSSSQYNCPLRVRNTNPHVTPADPVTFSARQAPETLRLESESESAQSNCPNIQGLMLAAEFHNVPVDCDVDVGYKYSFDSYTDPSVVLLSCHYLPNRRTANLHHRTIDRAHPSHSFYYKQPFRSDLTRHESCHQQCRASFVHLSSSSSLRQSSAQPPSRSDPTDWRASVPSTRYWRSRAIS